MSDGKYIDAPPEGIEGWRKVWQERLQYRGRIAPAFFSLAERAFEAAQHSYVARQRDFNIVLLDLLRDVRQDVSNMYRDYKGDLEDLRREISRLNELVPVASRRNDALVAALDQKIEALASRVRDISNPAVDVPRPSFAPGDFAYRRLEDGLRGSESETRADLAAYVEMITEGPAIDIGCGRGEFLQLCSERGIDAIGYDVNERSVADLVARGLRVELLGIPDCLYKHADGTAGAIFASHVVEHLPFTPLVTLFAESARVLRKGGLFMLETPNAESMAMTASDFWRDPTHLGPRHIAALIVLGREHGFEVRDVTTLHPFPDAQKVRVSEEAATDVRALAESVNAILFGDQDLRIVLRKI